MFPSAPGDFATSKPVAGNGVAFTRLSVRIVPVSVALMGASDFTPPNTTANADVHPSENVSELVRIPEITIGKQEGRRAGGRPGERARVRLAQH